MPYIALPVSQPSKVKIMIFAEGTILKPKSPFSLYNHRTYIPIGNAVSIIENWRRQNAEILYCTSRKGKQAEDIAHLLRRYRFAGSKLYYREEKQKYKDIIEEVRPDILIEDDCRSIGGSWQMCITHVAPSIRTSIKSIVVKEFRGIDHLPLSVPDLGAEESISANQI